MYVYVVHVCVCGACMLTYVLGGACICMLHFFGRCCTYICYGTCIHTSSILVVFGGACMCMWCIYADISSWCMYVYVVHESSHVLSGGCGTVFIMVN